MARTLEQILQSRDARQELDSNLNLMTGLIIPTSLQQFNSFANAQKAEGFFFGQSVWGIDVFSSDKSALAEKYGI